MGHAKFGRRRPPSTLCSSETLKHLHLLFLRIRLPPLRKWRHFIHFISLVQPLHLRFRKGSAPRHMVVTAWLRLASELSALNYNSTFPDSVYARKKLGAPESWNIASTSI